MPNSTFFDEINIVMLLLPGVPAGNVRGRQDILEQERRGIAQG